MKFGWPFWAKTSYTYEKNKNANFDQNVKRNLHLDRPKAFGFDFQIFEWISKAFYQWFVEKGNEMKSMQLCQTCTTFPHQKSSLFELRNVFQSHSAFQSKNGSVSSKKSAKSGTWPKFPPFGHCFCDSDEKRFLASSTPKPCANQWFLVHFAIAVFSTKTGISHVHF